MSTGARLLAHIARIKTVSEAIATRQCVRKFLDIPVPKSILEDILNTASISVSETQGWTVHVVMDDTKSKMIQMMEKWDTKVETNSQLEPVNDTLKAPVGLVIAVDELKMNNIEYVNLGMYMQNVMLLSREKGLHTCSFNSWAAFPGIHGILKMPKSEKVFSSIAMGYGDSIVKEEEVKENGIDVIRYDEV